MRPLLGGVIVALALAVARCTVPPRAGGPEISCGPLDRRRCADAVEAALDYWAVRGRDAIRKVEFTDAGGAYLVTFADGTSAGVAP